MQRLAVTKRPDGRWDVEADGEWRGEIRCEPDGLGYESRRAPGAMWDWVVSFAGALADLLGKDWPH
jgi:hypothetical protein